MAAVEADFGAAPRDAEPDHHPKVGVMGAASVVAGNMVGSGVYLLPVTMGAIGSISLLGWGAATLAAVAIAGVFISLAPRAPEARGMAGFVGAGLGPFWAVQTTVFYWVGCWVSLVAVALAAAGAAGFLFPALAAPGPRLATTIAMIWVGIGIAWMGSRAVARAQGLTLALGLLPVIATASVGWAFFHPEILRQSWNPTGLTTFAAVRGSALSAFWAFLGLEAAAAASGIVRNPARNVPRATALGLGGVTVLYLASNAAIMGILPASALAASSAPFADAAKIAMGAGAGVAIALCVFIRVTGCLCVISLVTAETSRSAADGGAFFGVFRSRPGERRSVVGLLAAGALTTGLALATATPDLAAQFSTVANVVSLLSLYAYGLSAASLLALLRGERRAIAPTITAVAAIGFCLLLVASGKPLEIGYTLIPVVAATGLYLALRRRQTLFGSDGTI